MARTLPFSVGTPMPAAPAARAFHEDAGDRERQVSAAPLDNLQVGRAENGWNPAPGAAYFRGQHTPETAEAP
ncbi:MAG: hypothetical protein OXH42_01600 [Acidimicrobiaceae bacterium]|nr:hypothetical protein [Acidimicrobiaceae bacterium]